MESFRVVSNWIHSDFPNPFNLSGLGEFPEVEVLETAFKITERKPRRRSFALSRKRERRQFHVVVVQCQQRNVTKSTCRVVFHINNIVYL